MISFPNSWQISTWVKSPSYFFLPLCPVCSRWLTTELPLCLKCYMYLSRGQRFLSFEELQIITVWSWSAAQEQHISALLQRIKNCTSLGDACQLAHALLPPLYSYLASNDLRSFLSHNILWAPIPSLHPKRQTNYLIACSLQKWFGGHIYDGLRLLPDLEQKKKSRMERKNRVFEAKLQIETNASLLVLLDDVITTGNTMKAATKALRHSGFEKKILGLAFFFRERQEVDNQ